MLCLEGLTSIGDYFVISTGRNPRHLKALAREVDETVDRLDVPCLGSEGTPESGWILVDLGDVVVHIFDAERRRIYNLETLWGDAPEVEWEEEGPGGEEREEG